MTQSLFHLALNVSDLEKADDFYHKVLGAIKGRSTDTWVDYNFFGHQLSLHLGKPIVSEYSGKVDNIAVPIPHFGIILPVETWEQMAKTLSDIKTIFVVPPTTRFKGQSGEQHTMFFLDPFGNPIEFKSFSNMDRVFS